jgi:hypothetical protein
MVSLPHVAVERKRNSSENLHPGAFRSLAPGDGAVTRRYPFFTPVLRAGFVLL